MSFIVSKTVLQVAIALSFTVGAASAEMSTPLHPQTEATTEFQAEAFSSIEYESVDPSDLSEQGRFVPLAVAIVVGARVATMAYPVVVGCTKKADACADTAKKVINFATHPIQTTKDAAAKVKATASKAKAVVVKAACKAGKKC